MLSRGARLARYHVPMFRASAIFASCVTAQAGCLSFVEVDGSACTTASNAVQWLSRPATLEPVRGRSSYYDGSIRDPALDSGVRAGGDQRFRFAPAGPHLLEVFLTVADGGRHSFTLEAGGRPVDTRYQVRPGPQRLRPKRGTRRLSLLAVLTGPAHFVVRTGADSYVLSAVRWTPREQFETELVPRWRERIRRLAASAIFEGQEGGPSSRRGYLEQLGDRVFLSRDPAARREGLIALTRAFYWAAAENHEPADIERTAELFEQCLRLAPDDLIVQQMISASCAATNTSRPGAMPEGEICARVKPVPWDVPVPDPPQGAPAWAVEQRRLAHRMDAITRWWVEVRQQENGELGGGWGDDVEILRSWGPQALGLGSEVAARGLERLADGLWSSGTLLHGYDKAVSDVEHSSEPTTDTQPLLAALQPDHPEALGRLRQTSACAENWIARQPDGRWRFRSSWFNCQQVDASPGRALDVHLNVRAMGPALWYAYFTRDRALIELLARWASSWAEAMRSTAGGKPAGAIPSAVKSVDGSYLIGSEAWDKPNAEWDYFQWSGRSQEALASLFLALHDLTGDPKWLEAAGESFRVLDRCGDLPRICEQIKASPEAFHEWRKRSGDTRYDRFFSVTAVPRDEPLLAQMTSQARALEQSLANNFDMLTSEVLYTDRVYYTPPAEYRQRLFGGDAPRGERYPAFAVTWVPSRSEYARAVIDARPGLLRLRAYNFERKPVIAQLRAWRLAPGRYALSVRAEGRVISTGEVLVERRPQLIAIPLPPQEEASIRITKIVN